MSRFMDVCRLVAELEKAQLQGSEFNVVAYGNWMKVGRAAAQLGKGSSDDSGIEPLQLLCEHWLEAKDTKHRYGSILRAYFDLWLSQFQTEEALCEVSKADRCFFYWLDEGSGKMVDLADAGFPRDRLEQSKVVYLSPEEREWLEVVVDDNGLFRWRSTGSLVTTAVPSSTLQFDTGGVSAVFSEAATEECTPESAAPAVGQGQQSAEAAAELECQLYLTTYAWEGTLQEVNIVETKPSKELGAPATPLVPPEELPCNLESNVHAVEAEQHSSSSDCVKGTAGAIRDIEFMGSEYIAGEKQPKWIYTVDTAGRMYVNRKSKGAFQHSSFLSGAPVLAAGGLLVEDGKLVLLTAHSGHYKPTQQHFDYFCDYLKSKGVDMGNVDARFHKVK